MMFGWSGPRSWSVPKGVEWKFGVSPESQVAIPSTSLLFWYSACGIVASDRRYLWPRDGPIKRGRQPWEARSSSDGRRWDDDLFVPSCQSATGVIMLAYSDSWGPSGGQPRAECKVRKRRRASRQNKGSCKSSWDANTDWLLKAKP